jgi:hypothetical protein
VLDANVLRNDIRRACREGRRTVLVSTANAGFIRLFAPVLISQPGKVANVIEEAARHTS